MDETRLKTIRDIKDFLLGCAAVRFSPSEDEADRYAHISRVLKRLEYPRLSKADKGVVLRYLQVTSSYSRQQLTRLVARWHINRLAATPLVKRYTAPRTACARKYTAADVALLVEMDRANEDVCGPAIVHLLRRAFHEYGGPRYERLAGLSPSHLYNLRKSAGYQAQRTSFTKTQLSGNTIGVRCAPRPMGALGVPRLS